MSTVTTLLDTPKKTSLQSQSINLRAALKEFERCFSEQHGRKPKQTDIKSDLNIATKYKEYQRVQDVLAGKVAYERLNDVKPKRHARSKSRTDSGIGSSPRKQELTTPRKTSKQKTVELENDDLEEDAEILQPVLLNAIGPTPHRDGKVLGLFDLLSRSGSATTPSTARKRKMDELFEDTPAKRQPLASIQAPTGRSKGTEKHDGDLLDFLSGTPVKQAQSHSGARYSRTPQSEGKKFQLSKFFATPETARILFQVPEETEDDNRVTNAEKKPASHETPRKEPDTTGLDATPTYLRRSTSFKDRLLSASMGPGASLANDSRRSSSMNGPPTLRSFRSSTSNVLKDIDPDTTRSKKTPPQRSIEVQDDEDDHDDELDALRELEAEEHASNPPAKVLVEDSQLNLDTEPDFAIDTIDGQVTKPYKKKGQKRTTKRVNIKPIIQSTKPTSEPKFVAADGTFSDDDEEDEFIEEGNASEDETKSTEKVKKGKKGGKQAGMINPNAQSHTNYRSLKIRGRSHKASGASGKTRFGRRK